MKTIAKALESMLTKDATQSWDGRAVSTPAPEGIWWWNPASQDVDFDI